MLSVTVLEFIDTQAIKTRLNTTIITQI